MPVNEHTNPHTGTTIWLAGGYGFVGRVLAENLSGLGHKVGILSRGPDSEVIVHTDYSRASLECLFKTGDTLVNLIGILNESGFDGSGFRHAHVELTHTLCDAAVQNGILRYLHMSALGASSDGPSHYLSSKAQAEEVVAQSGLDFTIFRPSVIFGPQDSFTNRFARLIRITPGIMPLACAESRFQPVYVGDVAECFVQSLILAPTIGQRYDICGPEIFSLREIVDLIARRLNKKCRVIPLNPFLSRLQAGALQFIPGKPFTLDNYRSLQVNSVCSSSAKLPFGLEHRRLAEAMDQYLG